MAKTFIPKTLEISEKVQKRLLDTFKNLKIDDIEDIKGWNHEKSPSGGSVIDPDNEMFPCSPFEGGEKDFLEKYPDGKIFKIESL